MSAPHDRRKIVLITGCASPISLGSAIALAFLQSGYRVIATCRAPVDRLLFLQAKGCETLDLDVTDEASLQGAVAAVHGLTGGVFDVLVNNVSLAVCDRG